MKPKFPPQIEKLKGYCWVCDKYDQKKRVHIISGGIDALKLCRKVIKKKVYVFSRCAPIGCYLAHTEKEIKNFYKSKDWYGWKHGGKE